MPAETRGFVQRAGHKRSRMTAEDKLQADRGRYQAWLQSLPAVCAADAHQPDFDVVVAAVPGKCHAYACARCHSVRDVVQFRALPCSGCIAPPRSGR